MKRILSFPRNIFFLGLTSFFNDFSSEMIYAAFPAFFTSVLKAGAGSLGLVDGIAEAASNFFKIYSGNLSDRTQKRKPLVVAGYTISVFTRPFYILFASVGGAAALRFIDRVGKGLRDAPRDSIISLSVGKEELGRSFGFHRSMDTLGSIAGPLAAYFLLLNFPGQFGSLFMVAFVIGIIAIFSLLFITEVAPNVGARAKTFIGSFGSYSGQYKLYVLSIFVLSMGALPVAVMLLKTQSLGLNIADIPLFYVIYSVSYTIFSFIAGVVSDKVGTKVVIFVGYGALLGSYYFISAATTAISLGIAFFILGLFPALTDGVQRSLASKLTAVEGRGGALGLLNAAVGFGALVAGGVGGYVWETMGSAAAFLIAAKVLIVGLALFFVALRFRRS